MLLCPYGIIGRKTTISIISFSLAAVMNLMQLDDLLCDCKAEAGDSLFVARELSDGKTAQKCG
jgi:selenophosphate synthetase-related protein